jgi:hypothetical protein
MHININKLHEPFSASNDNIFPSTVKVHKHEILRNFFLDVSVSRAKFYKCIDFLLYFAEVFEVFPCLFVTELRGTVLGVRSKDFFGRRLAFGCLGVYPGWFFIT